MQYITKTEISQERYKFKTSNLHSRVLRVILHLEHPSLPGKTVVYILNLAVPNSVFSPSYSSSAFSRSNATPSEVFLTFQTSICSTLRRILHSVSGFLTTFEYLSKTTKNKDAIIYFVQAAFSSWPASNCASRQVRLTYLQVVAQLHKHSLMAVSKLSTLVLLSTDLCSSSLQLLDMLDHVRGHCRQQHPHHVKCIVF